MAKQSNRFLNSTVLSVLLILVTAAGVFVTVNQVQKQQEVRSRAATNTPQYAGGMDVASCQVIKGWACDKANPSTTVPALNITLQATDGSDTLIGLQAQTGQNRQPFDYNDVAVENSLKSQSCGGTSLGIGWTLRVPDSVKNGKTYKVLGNIGSVGHEATKDLTYYWDGTDYANPKKQYTISCGPSSRQDLLTVRNCKITDQNVNPAGNCGAVIDYNFSNSNNGEVCVQINGSNQLTSVFYSTAPNVDRSDVYTLTRNTQYKFFLLGARTPNGACTGAKLAESATISPYVEVFGKAFIDTNRNGQFDSGDNPLVNTRIDMEEYYGAGYALIAQQNTDSQGNYTITNLSPQKTYRISIALPSGTQLINPTSNPFQLDQLPYVRSVDFAVAYPLPTNTPIPTRNPPPTDTPVPTRNPPPTDTPVPTPSPTSTVSQLTGSISGPSSVTVGQTGLFPATGQVTSGSVSQVSVKAKLSNSSTVLDLGSTTCVTATSCSHTGQWQPNQSQAGTYTVFVTVTASGGRRCTGDPAFSNNQDPNNPYCGTSSNKTVRIVETPTVTTTQFAGDVNNDGTVDIIDYVTVVSHFGQTANRSQGDLTGNNKVDIFDYTLVVSDFGKRR